MQKNSERKMQLEELLKVSSKVDWSPNIHMNLMVMCMESKDNIIPTIIQIIKDSKTEEQVLRKIEEAGMILPDIVKEAKEARESASKQEMKN